MSWLYPHVNKCDRGLEDKKICLYALMFSSKTSVFFVRKSDVSHHVSHERRETNETQCLTVFQ